MLLATCRVVAVRPRVLGKGRSSSPAFSSWKIYWFAAPHALGLARLTGSLGWQPFGFGPGGLFRLATNSRRPLGETATPLGYQPVGISAWTGLAAAPGATSATALIPPRVTSRLPLRSAARAFG